MEELKTIMEKFATSGWDLIFVPTQQWLDGKADKDTLVSAIKQAEKECGNCGCDLDPLYKRALKLLLTRYQFNLPSENRISTTKMPLHGQNPDSGISLSAFPAS